MQSPISLTSEVWGAHYYAFYPLGAAPLPSALLTTCEGVAVVVPPPLNNSLEKLTFLNCAFNKRPPLWNKMKGVSVPCFEDN